MLSIVSCIFDVYTLSRFPYFHSIELILWYILYSISLITYSWLWNMEKRITRYAIPCLFELWNVKHGYLIWSACFGFERIYVLANSGLLNKLNYVNIICWSSICSHSCITHPTHQGSFEFNNYFGIIAVKSDVFWFW